VGDREPREATATSVVHLLGRRNASGRPSVVYDDTSKKRGLRMKTKPCAVTWCYRRIANWALRNVARPDPGVR
jgi:hypothetical protein